MEVWKLPNGLRVIYKRKPGNSVSIEVLVDVGSNDESPAARGVSHFIEHMVFEGTEKRPSAKEIANAVESLGGDINAYTTNTRTCFYAKVLKKHFGVALDVISDILQRPIIRTGDIERQRGILSREIDMVMDEPRFYQWILFQKTLFKVHPVRFPTYGSHQSVAKISKAAIEKHFKRFYRPEGMVVCVVGDVPGARGLVGKAFSSKIRGRATHKPENEPMQKKLRIVREKRNIGNTYFVLGYRTVPRLHPDSYTLDVIDAVLGRGQSGWLFDEVRNRHGLAYDVGTQHIAERDYGYFAAYASAEKKNVENHTNQNL